LITDSFAAGDEVANIGVITTLISDGKVMDVAGAFVYKNPTQRSSFVHPSLLGAGSRAEDGS
jgi:hypothetical protein